MEEWYIEICNVEGWCVWRCMEKGFFTKRYCTDSPEFEILGLCLCVCKIMEHTFSTAIVNQ